MLDITAEEKQAFADANTRSQEIRQELHQLDTQLRRIPDRWATTRGLEGEEEAKALSDREEQIEGLKSQISSLKEELDSVEHNEAVLSYALKTGLNEKLAEILPGGSPGAILNIIEGLVEGLQGETGQRVGSILKKLGLTALEAMADQDIQAARAKVTALRYSSLVAAGLPESVAAQVLVAEASRPINFPSGSVSRK